MGAGYHASAVMGVPVAHGDCYQTVKVKAFKQLRRDNDLLYRMLYTEGRINQEQYISVLEDVLKSGTMAGQAMVRLGMMSRAEVDDSVIRMKLRQHSKADMASTW